LCRCYPNCGSANLSGMAAFGDQPPPLGRTIRFRIRSRSLSVPMLYRSLTASKHEDDPERYDPCSSREEHHDSEQAASGHKAEHVKVCHGAASAKSATSKNRGPQPLCKEHFRFFPVFAGSIVSEP